jgi:ATP/ADP translocase
MAGIKSRDRYTIIFAAFAALLMIGHLQGGKTVRDALFLSYFNVTDLPKMMIATAILSAVAVVIFSRVLARYGPARLMPPFYILSGIISFGEWVAMALWPHIVTVALYLHVTVFDALLISGFWSIINERYDPYSAKNVISHMVIFTALGGLFGAGAAAVVAKTVDIRAVIAMLAILHVVTGLALFEVTRGQTRSNEQRTSPQGLLSVLKRNSLIQRMALLMLMLAVTITMLDYLFKATLQASIPKEQLVTFFAYFYIAIDIGSFLLQTFVGRRALQWFGFGGTIVVLPLSIIFGSLITCVFRSLTSVTLLRGAANLITNSFFGPGYELFFTPISPADKRTSKILIDVGANRSGNMLGGLLIMGLLLLPGSTGLYILLTVMVFAGMMSLLIFLLNRGYISQLAQNLLSTKPKANEANNKDKAPHTGLAFSRKRLEPVGSLQQMSAYHSRDNLSQEQPANLRKTVLAHESTPSGTHDAAQMETIQDLLSQDENRIRRTLVNKKMTPALLPHILPLLRSQGVLKEALNAIKPLTSSASGQLVDALLDHHQHPLIRRRIPLLLGQADNERAVQGLTLGLQDKELDVRFRCAEALARIKSNHPELTIDTEAIWRCVYREIAFFSGSGFKSIRGVEPLRHLFNLFGIIFGPDVMDICYESLQVEDLSIRGTALEYLENQLPQNVRTPLWPLIESGHIETKSDRSSQDIMQDLLQALDSAKNRDDILELSVKDLERLD